MAHYRRMLANNAFPTVSDYDSSLSISHHAPSPPSYHAHQSPPLFYFRSTPGLGFPLVCLHLSSELYSLHVLPKPRVSLLLFIFALSPRPHPWNPSPSPTTASPSRISSILRFVKRAFSSSFSFLPSNGFLLVS